MPRPRRRPGCSIARWSSTGWGWGAESLEALDRIVPMTRYGARVLAGVLGPACGRLAPPVPHPADGRVAPPRLDPAARARRAGPTGPAAGRDGGGAPSCPQRPTGIARASAWTFRSEGSPVFARSVAGPPPVLVLHAAPRGPCGDLPEIAARGRGGPAGRRDRGGGNPSGLAGSGPRPALRDRRDRHQYGGRRRLGLVAVEHAAAGAAQVVPGRGATAEIWRGGGPPAAAGSPSPEDVAGALAALNRAGAAPNVWPRCARAGRASDPAAGPGSPVGRRSTGVAGGRAGGAIGTPVFPHRGKLCHMFRKSRLTSPCRAVAFHMWCSARRGRRTASLRAREMGDSMTDRVEIAGLKIRPGLADFMAEECICRAPASNRSAFWEGLPGDRSATWGRATRPSLAEREAPSEVDDWTPGSGGDSPGTQAGYIGFPEEGSAICGPRRRRFRSARRRERRSRRIADASPGPQLVGAGIERPLCPERRPMRALGQPL